MSIKLSVTVPGNGIVEISAGDAKEAIEEASFWQSLPEKCPVCGEDVRFFHFTPQKYVYYGLVCRGSTPHKVNFGQHMDGGKLFFDKNKTWEVAQFQQRPSDIDEELKQPPAQAKPQPAQSEQAKPSTIRTVVETRDAETPMTAKDFSREKCLVQIKERRKRITELGGVPRLPSHVPSLPTWADYNDVMLLTINNHLQGQLREAMDAKIEQEEREAIAAT